MMAIFSAIMACTLLSLAGISMSMTYIGSEGFITSTIEMVIGGVMLIVGITSASLTCRPLCCPPSSSSSSQQGLVYYQAPNQVDIASLNLPLPTPLLSSAQVYYFCLKNSLNENTYEAGCGSPMCTPCLPGSCWEWQQEVSEILMRDANSCTIYLSCESVASTLSRRLQIQLLFNLLISSHFMLKYASQKYWCWY